MGLKAYLDSFNYIKFELKSSGDRPRHGSTFQSQQYTRLHARDNHNQCDRLLQYLQESKIALAQADWGLMPLSGEKVECIWLSNKLDSSLVVLSKFINFSVLFNTINKYEKQRRERKVSKKYNIRQNNNFV